MRKLTTQEFIEQAKSVHGELYEYDKVLYQSATKKVTITCKVHGDFEQLPYAHKRGRGCSKCVYEDNTNDINHFITEANKVHNFRYDYSKSVYEHSKHKLIIICKEHGEFEQAPNPHLKGCGCPSCKKITLKNKLSSNTQNFIEKANKIHMDKYDYSKVLYSTNKVPVLITCRIHGDFKQRPDSHLNGKGCSRCKISHSIREIMYILNKNDIKYISEKRFDDCKNTSHLPFDLYIEKYNLCIEYDGRHHYMPVEHWGGEYAYKQTKTNDNIKNVYCDKNNINLLRIPYNTEHLSVLKEYFK